MATSAGDTLDTLHYFTDNLKNTEQKAGTLDQAYCFRIYADILQKTGENLDEALRMFKRSVGIYESHQVYEDAGFIIYPRKAYSGSR